MRSCIFIHALLLASAFAASAAEPQKLTGTYTLSPDTVVDAKPNVKPGTDVRFYLTGKAAADMYGALASKPEKDECFADGSLTKAQGNFRCTKGPKGTFECWFGVDLRSQKLTPGFVC